MWNQSFSSLRLDDILNDGSILNDSAFFFCPGVKLIIMQESRYEEKGWESRRNNYENWKKETDASNKLNFQLRHNHVISYYIFKLGLSAKMSSNQVATVKSSGESDSHNP